MPWQATASGGGKTALATCSLQVDLVRLDHFRGFEAHWEIPATDTTACPWPLAGRTGLPFLRSA
jgi:4-alpha-glucanotransferase